MSISQGTIPGLESSSHCSAHMILDKSRSLFLSQFPSCKMGRIMLPYITGVMRINILKIVGRVST